MEQKERTRAEKKREGGQDRIAKKERGRRERATKAKGAEEMGKYGKGRDLRRKGEEERTRRQTSQATETEGDGWERGKGGKHGEWRNDSRNRSRERKRIALKRAGRLRKSGSTGRRSGGGGENKTNSRRAKERELKKQTNQLHFETDRPNFDRARLQRERKQIDVDKRDLEGREVTYIEDTTSLRKNRAEYMDTASERGKSTQMKIRRDIQERREQKALMGQEHEGGGGNPRIKKPCRAQRAAAVCTDEERSQCGSPSNREAQCEAHEITAREHARTKNG